LRNTALDPVDRAKIKSVQPLLPIDAETPRSLVLDPPLTDAEFEALCASSDWFRFERTRKGEVLMHPPAGGLTSDGNGEIIAQLRSWWKTHRQGRVFDSSAGFYLPDSSVLNPDAAYILPHKLKGLTKDELTGFPRFCPDFVIELLSTSDSVSRAEQKMERWIENGAQLGWLIDPYQKKVFVYEPGREVFVVSGSAVSGKGPVEGFTLDLDELWRCYEV
jgi:Uma2 family endonuclease